MVTVPFGEIVTFHTPASGATDRYGNPVPSWVDAAVPGCAVWPTQSSEDTAGVDFVTDSISIIPPDGTTVDAHAEATWRGRRYRVDGEPALFSSPLTGSQLTQVRLVRVH